MEKRDLLVLSCVSCGENMICESIHEGAGEPICKECVLNAGLPPDFDGREVTRSVWRCEF